MKPCQGPWSVDQGPFRSPGKPGASQLSVAADPNRPYACGCVADREMRAIIADDQIAIRRALRLLLEEVPAAQVVGEASDLNTLADLVASASPDLVLLDWELPPGDTAARVAGLRGQFPRVRLIVLSTSPEAANEALAAGADAFVSKGDAPEGLARLLRELSCPRGALAE